MIDAVEVLGFTYSCLHNDSHVSVSRGFFYAEIASVEKKLYLLSTPHVTVNVNIHKFIKYFINDYKTLNSCYFNQ
jgi:hypothetical protein